MAFPYFPQTAEDVKQMLEKAGAASLEDLYSDVPASVFYRGQYDLPDAMSEVEVRKYFRDLASLNTPLTIFAGGGAYDHYAPAVIPYITSRSEFLTAYTPYQAEISQGTLRYIFEFQSMVAELTGMDVANASMYDGATAASEAMLMCVASARKKNRVLVSESLLPQVLKVVKTYMGYHGVEFGFIEAECGQTSLESLKKGLEAGDVAGILVPGINRWGVIEDLADFADTVHAAGALMAVYSDPSSLAVVRTPAEWGADIACGDCQSLGIPLCFGGPYVGFLSCRKEYVRKLPGRIVGATRDVDGKRAFVLTLQAREQHIRREKATSNICSNQSLMALYVTVYLSLMGRKGLVEANELCMGGAHYLYDQLLATGLFHAAFDKPFLKEFAVKSDIPAAELQKALVDAGFFGAVDAGDSMVTFCVTEKRTRSEIDAMVEVIRGIRK